jgi:predicted ATP-grasp superfamily ATP-dependent carboligase
MKLYISQAIFDDWVIALKNYSFINYIENDEKIELSNYKIIPICKKDFIKHSNKLLFTTEIDVINILDNKALFAKFMMENFNNYIPETVYYNIDNIQIYNTNKIFNKMIQKPIYGYSSVNVKIVYEIENIENTIISNYIIHNVIYSGHFLYINGTLLDKIYFYREIPQHCLYKGRIINYKITENISCDDNIFIEILKKINYSGFSNVDFTICNNKIIIFEINPRIGGSLIHNQEILNRFITKLNKYYELYT